MNHSDHDELTGMPGMLRHEQEQLMGKSMKAETLNPEHVNMPLIDAMYRMDDVDRFSGFPMNKKNSLAVHCYNVGNLFIEIARAEHIHITIEEIAFVFRHDILETVTGDMLNPAKRWTAAINDHWDAIEEALVNSNEFSWAQPYTDKWAKDNMSDKAHELFLECDRLDLCLMLQREIKKGNVYYMTTHRELGCITCPIEHWLNILDTSQFYTVRNLADQIRVDLYE